MIKTTIKLAASSAMLLGLLATTASADVKLNDNLTLSGYLSGSYTFNDPTPGKATDTVFKGLPSDSSQLLLKGTFAPITGVASVYFVPNSSTSEVNVLDANVTYDAGGGLSVTGGRFLSYMGYESFFTANNPEITFANNDFLGAIPGFHEGIRVDFSNADVATGFALADSEFTSGIKGDSEMKQNAGLEGFLSLKSIPDVTLWAGVAYETKGGPNTRNITTLDFWGEYALNKTTKLAAEYAHKEGPGVKGYNWLALLTFAASDKTSVALRASGETIQGGGPKFVRGTICPAYAVTDKFTIRAEYSYTDYKKFALTSNNFFGFQGLLKF